MLSDATTGGTWTSSAPGYALVDTFTGKVHGVYPGTATITYTTPTYGCSAFLSFTTLPILVPTVGITMTTSTTICAGTYVTYTANVTNGGATPTYQWRINGVVTGTGTSLTYAPVNGDSVSIMVTSTAACAIPLTAKSYVRMTVNPLLVPSVNITTGVGDTVCLASSITFSPNPVNGGSTPTFNWKVNGVSVWTGPTWTYYPANGDIVSVVMHTSATCRTSDTAIDTDRITVSPYVTPTVTISGSDTACGGYPIVLHANQTGGGTAPTYQWYKNGTAFATGATLAYIATTGDVIRVQMTSNFPCVTGATASSANDTITVIPVYMPTVSVIVAPGFILAAGTTAWFAATVTNGGSSPTYQWYRNGTPISGATTLYYHTNVITSMDSFILRATNHDYCNGITAFGYVRVIIGDNVGVNELEAANASLTMLPNPNNGSFTIKGSLAANIDEDVDVEVTNMLGQVIYKDRVRAAAGLIDQRISLDGPPANGMYMISVHSEHISKVIRFALEK